MKAFTKERYTFTDAQDAVYNDDELITEIMGELTADHARLMLDGLEGSRDSRYRFITLFENMVGEYVWAAEQRGEIIITGKE